MNPTTRGRTMQALAELLEEQIEAIRTRDVDRYLATQASMEATCAELRRKRGEPSAPAARAWAATVRRLAATVRELLASVRAPWTELVKEVVGQSAGRASPVGIDMKV